MKALDLTTFTPKYNSKIFLDSNIWIYLYYPHFSTISQKIVDNYSVFFNDIVTKECLIVTDMIQMSELINLIIQKEYKDYCKSNLKHIPFKEFRNLNECEVALSNAKAVLDNILKVTTLKGGIFTPEELKDIVLTCDKADFNDIYFTQFCKKEDAILITHDFDFHTLPFDLDIYTYNRRYLYA